MALFGWLVLVALAVVLSAMAFAVVVGSLRLMGRLGAEAVAFVAASALVWYGVVALRPFTLAII